MSFSVRVRDGLGVVELRFEGAVDVKQLSETRVEMRRLLEEDPTRNALVDMRNMEFAMSTFDIFSFASTIQLSAPARIALVSSPKDDDVAFFETVAKNRGVSIRLFTDLNDALGFVRK